MTTADIVELIRTVGFPIFVCLWFMLRLERRLDRLVGVFTILVSAIPGHAPGAREALEKVGLTSTGPLLLGKEDKT